MGLYQFLNIKKYRARSKENYRKGIYIYDRNLQRAKRKAVKLLTGELIEIYRC